jgi:phage tail P2-like protein
MTKIESARLSEILPSSLLRDEKIKALAHALDTEIMALTAATREVLHLPRLDELSGPILDLLAEQFHVDFYEPLYLDDEMKKELIRGSIAWHRIKGTRAAVEQVMALFGRKIRLKEWYEYGGNPYWFKIIMAPFKSELEFNQWVKKLNDAKNVRSHCAVTLEMKGKATAYVGIAEYRHGLKKIPRDPAPVLVPMPPIKHKARAYAGIVTYRYGRKKIKPLSFVIMDNNVTTIEDGQRTLIINASRVVIRYGESEEVVPLNIFGDQLRMTFTFPKSERVIHYKNPREDLTAAEVQAVADFAVENEIFLDRNEDTAQDLNRAVIVSTETQILF